MLDVWLVVFHPALAGVLGQSACFYDVRFMTLLKDSKV